MTTTIVQARVGQVRTDLDGLEPDQVASFPPEVGGLVRFFQRGGEVPPIVVMDAENGLRILDGCRRFRSARQAGIESIPAWIISGQEYYGLLAERFGGWEPADPEEILPHIQCGEETAAELAGRLRREWVERSIRRRIDRLPPQWRGEVVRWVRACGRRIPPDLLAALASGLLARFRAQDSRPGRGYGLGRALAAWSQAGLPLPEWGTTLAVPRSTARLVRQVMPETGRGNKPQRRWEFAALLRFVLRAASDPTWRYWFWGIR